MKLSEDPSFWDLQKRFKIRFQGKKSLFGNIVCILETMSLVQLILLEENRLKARKIDSLDEKKIPKWKIGHNIGDETR